MELTITSNRARLIAEGTIQDFPVVKRPHNRHRKDGKLTPEQVENLSKIYGLDVRVLNKMTEQEILASLRKRHKHYKFNQINLS